MKQLFSFLILAFIFSQSLWAQDPGAAEDEREARLKVLKTADQVEMIQANSEALRTDVETLKSELTRIQDENNSLKQEVTDLKASLQKMDEARVKEREVLLAEVSKLVAGAGKATAAALPLVEKKKTDDIGIVVDDKPQHGFYHTVEKGETLSMISKAYRDQGVKVTIEDIRKANSLEAHQTIRVGQKLFIPKNEE